MKTGRYSRGGFFPGAGQRCWRIFCCSLDERVPRKGAVAQAWVENAYVTVDVGLMRALQALFHSTFFLHGLGRYLFPVEQRIPIVFIMRLHIFMPGIKIALTLQKLNSNGKAAMRKMDWVMSMCVTDLLLKLHP